MTAEQPSPYLSEDPTWANSLVPCHLMRVELEPAEKLPPYDSALVNLTSAMDQWDMSTFRTVRLGGMNAADQILRQNLCTIVGAIAVAGGHIEAEMKRIIILAEEDRGATFVDVDLTWTGLETRMQAIADGEGPLSAEVAEHLTWAKAKRIKQTRDDAIHCAWTLYDIGCVQKARFKKRSEGYTESGTLEDYASHVPKMIEYAARLGAIGGWPTRVLPPLPNLPTAGTVQIHWKAFDTDVQANHHENVDGGA